MKIKFGASMYKSGEVLNEVNVSRFKMKITRIEAGKESKKNSEDEL